jgi:hypothetical protein
MQISFTGIGYLLGFLGMGLLAFRFFQYWQAEKSRISQIFFYMMFSFSLFMLVVAIGGLFFSKNTQALRIVEILSVFIQSFPIACIAYVIVFVRFPKFSPNTAFFIFLILEFLATIATIIFVPSPYLDNGGINWDVQLIPAILRMVLSLISMIPGSILMVQEFKKSKESYARIKALGLLLMLAYGIVLFSLDLNILKLPAISGAICIGVMSIFAFLIIFSTRNRQVNKDFREN